MFENPIFYLLGLVLALAIVGEIVAKLRHESLKQLVADIRSKIGGTSSGTGTDAAGSAMSNPFTSAQAALLVAQTKAVEAQTAASKATAAFAVTAPPVAAAAPGPITINVHPPVATSAPPAVAASDGNTDQYPNDTIASLTAKLIANHKDIVASGTDTIEMQIAKGQHPTLTAVEWYQLRYTQTSYLVSLRLKYKAIGQVMPPAAQIFSTKS